MPRHIPSEVTLRLAAMARDAETRNLGPQEIHARLCAEFPEYDPEPIGLRTVQERWAGLHSESEPWTLGPAETEPAFLLDCLALDPELTNEQAELLRVIHKGRPNRSAAEALDTARFYLASRALPGDPFNARITILFATDQGISQSSVSAAAPASFPRLRDRLEKGNKK